MPEPSANPPGTRGEIERLPSGSLRVRVYAGIDPVTRKRRYLTETVPAGPTATTDALAARARLVRAVDAQRAAARTAPGATTSARPGPGAATSGPSGSGSAASGPGQGFAASDAGPGSAASGPGPGFAASGPGPGFAASGPGPGFATGGLSEPGAAASARTGPDHTAGRRTGLGRTATNGPTAPGDTPSRRTGTGGTTRTATSDRAGMNDATGRRTGLGRTATNGPAAPGDTATGRMGPGGSGGAHAGPGKAAGTAASAATGGRSRPGDAASTASRIGLGDAAGTGTRPSRTAANRRTGPADTPSTRTRPNAATSGRVGPSGTASTAANARTGANAATNGRSRPGDAITAPSGRTTSTAASDAATSRIRPGGAGGGRAGGLRVPRERAEPAGGRARERRGSDLTGAAIARLAGVSTATVSKVLNGRSGVAAETRRRVETVLREHRYRRPDAPARTASIEVVFYGMLSHLAVAIMHGVEQVARAHNLSVGFTDVLQLSTDRSWAQDLLARRPAGVVTVHLSSPTEPHALLAASAIPLVALDPTGEPQHPVPSVGAADWNGALAAARHLLDLGHRRVAVITGPPDRLCARARLDGIRAALDGEGVPLDPRLVRTGLWFAFEDGLNHGRELLRLADPPTAILCGNDLQALGVYEAARRAGRRIPDDLSVVGFDDIAAALWCGPAMTTVRQPFTEMGATAATLVLALASGRPLSHDRVELATTLIVRDSTAPPRA